MEAALQGPFGKTTLSSGVLTIGSSPDNQLVVNDPKVSAHHAEVRPDVQGYSVVDLGSMHGTFVNGQRLDWNAPYVLNPGDSITIGDTTFSYISGESGTEPTVWHAPPVPKNQPMALTWSKLPPRIALTVFACLRSYRPPRKHLLPVKLVHRWFHMCRKAQRLLLARFPLAQRLFPGQMWVMYFLDNTCSHRGTYPSIPSRPGLSSSRIFLLAIFPAPLIRGM